MFYAKGNPYTKFVRNAYQGFFVSYVQNKWFGVLHHVVGEHEWHDGQCSHGPLTSADNGKPLLDKGSKAMDALRKVIMDRRWVESLIFYVWFKYVVAA